MKYLIHVCLGILFSLLAHDGYSQTDAFNLVKTTTVKISGSTYQKIIGSIEVKENRDKSNSRILKLPIEITKTNSPNPLEPVFYLEGGPGSSNIWNTGNTELLKNHDFVFVGYRGADGSTNLKSKNLAKAMKGLNGKLLSDESLDNVEKKLSDHLRVLKSKGIEVDQYNMVEVINDFESTRKALGYAKINLLSISYGTRVALIYSYMYPGSIHRSIMVGANPPGHFEWDPLKTEQILGIWDSLYVANNHGSIKLAMTKAFENMPKRWSGFRLDMDKIKCVTFAGLYQKDMAVMVFDAFLKAANRGDYSGLYLMQLLYDKLLSKNNYGDLFTKGFSADFQPNINYREKYRAFDQNTILGANYGLLLWGAAGAWKYPTIAEEYKKLKISNTQTLILSGDLDNSTPAEYATKKLIPTLPNGMQVILKNMSHADLLNAQTDNYRKFISLYFRTGTIDKSIFTESEIDFKPKRKFNNLAKWGYPLVLIMSIF